MRITPLLCLVVLGHHANADSSAPLSPQPAQAVGWYATLGAGWVPAGVDGPDSGSVELLEGGATLRAGALEARLGVIAAFESTSFQSSMNGLALARAERHQGAMFSWGAGLGVGYGNFSPMGTVNADRGGTPELATFVVPARLHVGPDHRVEVALQVGAIYLASFSEVDPFWELSVGYSR